MVQTYQGMNKEIVGILRAGGIPHEMYAAQYIEELQAKIEQLEAEVERLRAQVGQLRKACRPAEAFLFRLVRDSGNDDTDPAKPVLAAVRQALRETE